MSEKEDKPYDADWERIKEALKEKISPELLAQLKAMRDNKSKRRQGGMIKLRYGGPVNFKGTY